MNGINKRERLINAAATLFHRKGIEGTSLADIAKDAEIPIGNVYYYFKTKEDLAVSALLQYRDQYIALFRELNETSGDPRERLKGMITYFEAKAEEFARYGCPVTKFVVNTDIEHKAITEHATNVLQCFLQWSGEQFMELGHDEDTARGYAVQLLSGMEGAVMLAKALSEPSIILQEFSRLATFIEQVPNKRIMLGKIGAKASA